MNDNGTAKTASKTNKASAMRKASQVSKPLDKQDLKKLRGMANKLNPVILIGKSGVTDAELGQTSQTLESHELIKCGVLQNAPTDAKEAGATMADRLGATLVQVIGNRFVLYRRSGRKGFDHLL